MGAAFSSVKRKTIDWAIVAKLVSQLDDLCDDHLSHHPDDRETGCSNVVILTPLIYLQHHGKLDVVQLCETQMIRLSH